LTLPRSKDSISVSSCGERAMPFPRPLAVAGAVLTLVGGCTEAHLYHRDRSPAAPDRVTLRGRVCTDDPQLSYFPLKVVLVVDQAAGYSPDVDAATGGLFTDFDPEGGRLRALTDLVAMHQSDESVSFAVVGFGGRPRILAPVEGSFTRNVGELEAAISALGLQEGCEGGASCRDLRGALNSARTLIEGDLTALRPGQRAMTEYVVVLLLAGPPSPLPEGAVFCQRTIGGPVCCDPARMDCMRDLRARVCCDLDTRPCVYDEAGAIPCCCPDECPCDAANCAELPPDCSTDILVQDVRQMRESFEGAGVAGFRLHALHLSAEVDPVTRAPDPVRNDAVGRLLQDMAFAGEGRFQAYYDGSSLDAPGTSVYRLGLLQTQVELEAKDFVVYNMNAIPGAEGPVADSDADGLGDEAEADHGSNPGNPDTDGDGITDFVEVMIEFSPIVPDAPVACEGLVTGHDGDADGLTDCDEELIGTDPSLVDSDGDAMPDRLEVSLGTDYVRPDWLTDSDGDGVSNGDEVRNHTDPRSSDAASHLALQYRYTVVDEGIVPRIDIAEPRVVTGVNTVSATAGSTAGLGWLCYEPAVEGEAGPTLCWVDGGERTAAGGVVSCTACDSANPEATGERVEVEGDGTYALPSPSAREGVEAPEDWSVTVEVTVVDLPPQMEREQLLVDRDERHCLSFVVRNVKLVEAVETVMDPLPGWNNVALYFAEAPAGRMTVPGLFRVSMVPIRYAPPEPREPPDAELFIFDDEFVRAGTVQ